MSQNSVHQILLYIVKINAILSGLTQILVGSGFFLLLFGSRIRSIWTRIRTSVLYTTELVALIHFQPVEDCACQQTGSLRL